MTPTQLPPATLPRPTAKWGAGHLPQLDSLRSLAVALVVIYHWYPTGEGINRLPNGTIGVMIFFVISGFLITRILLNSRNQWQTGGSLGVTYRNFFIRRALRIFPLYYLAITAVYLFAPQVSDIRPHPLYYYLYGSNILLNQTGNWGDILSPFWTLGVEEQLYLVWPWVVLLLPKRGFHWAIVGLVLTGILFRGYGYARHDLDGVLMPANVDAFGLGALWAYLMVEQPNQISSFRQRLPVATLIALTAFVGLLLLPGDHLLVVLFQRFVISVLSLYLVVQATVGMTGVAGLVFNNRALQFVGRISYGIYVFHMLVPTFLTPFVFRVLSHLRPLPAISPNVHRLVSAVLLLIVASASWYLFEKPINNLKRHFQVREM